MDVWPAQLQQKLNVAQFQVQIGNTIVRSDMDVGPAKLRSRFTDGIDIYTCSINLDFDDYDVLTTFFKTTLNNGANQFEFDDPFTESPAAFRFVGPPQAQPLGGRVFQISMTWEKMP